MNKAIARLKQNLPAPSNEELRMLGMCHICWTDYEGEDCPVKLPCGHVFGKECIVAWARGTTPSGRYNGCPWCGTELLQPSLSSRLSGLKEWIDTFQLEDVVRVAGDFGVLGLLVLLTFTCLIELLPESHMRAELEVLMLILLLIHLAYTGVSLIGWKWLIPMSWAVVAVFAVGKTIMG